MNTENAIISALMMAGVCPEVSDVITWEILKDTTIKDWKVPRGDAEWDALMDIERETGVCLDSLDRGMTLQQLADLIVNQT